MRMITTGPTTTHGATMATPNRGATTVIRGATMVTGATAVPTTHGATVAMSTHGATVAMATRCVMATTIGASTSLRSRTSLHSRYVGKVQHRELYLQWRVHRWASRQHRSMHTYAYIHQLSSVLLHQASRVRLLFELCGLLRVLHQGSRQHVPHRPAPPQQLAAATTPWVPVPLDEPAELALDELAEQPHGTQNNGHPHVRPSCGPHRRRGRLRVVPITRTPDLDSPDRADDNVRHEMPLHKAECVLPKYTQC
jgi:hypothetical protein